jgi:hypothetical protein
MMPIIILLSAMLVFPSISHAVPLTLSFTGVTGVGTVEGTFTYETVQTPNGFDVRGLSNNATYALGSWNVLATSNFPGLPTTLFNGGSGQSVEFCQGNCVFSAPDVTNLIFRDSTSNTLLQLTFSLADPTPLTTPPASVQDWGAFVSAGSQYRIAQSVPLALLTDGSLSSVSVPEPANLAWLSLFAIVLLHRSKVIT